jgi:hypothetical protein
MRHPSLPVLFVALGVLMCLTLAAGTAPGWSSSPAPTVVDPSGQPIPVLAYYYIWFDPNSWNRAKVDYSALGRYSSSDVAVMRRQVALAKTAGITGFLVGWKDTPVLDRRLAALVKVAQAADFKLGLVFQGLDFHRNPLPMAEVRSSFSYFAARYAGNPVFDLFGKPVVVWSGTWMYTRAQMASITQAYGSRLSILASEKQPASYLAVADLFKGDAYYWSSVDPLATPGYQQKLDALAQTVHMRDGLWFAPAAPGYDARLIGGARVVPRRGGETLRLEMNAALQSSPDAIGVISWNEFSENTYVEPSRNYGSTSLKAIAGIEHANPGAIPNFDSSGPSGFHVGSSRFAILGVVAIILAGSAGAVVLRTNRGRR